MRRTGRMKRKISFLTVLLIIFVLLGACSPAQTPTGSASQPDVTASDETAPNEPTATPDTRTEAEKLADFYGGGYNTNTLIGIDQFGRTFETGGEDRKGKQVGIFYWPWFSEKSTTGVYNNTEILKMENGLKLLTSLKDVNPDISPAYQDHYWDEPLFGYYHSQDKWVIRRHLRMLGLAGVDYICFDATNGIAFSAVAKTVLSCIDELQKEGFNPPRLTFYTHYKSMQVVKRLYKDVYSANYCPNGWYTYDGKPMIIAYTEPKDDIKATGGPYNPSKYNDEIANFFTFVRPEWPNEYRMYKDSIAWVEWKYPIPYHGKFSAMTVSPSAHVGCPYSYSLTGHTTNWGRGWDPQSGQNISENVEKGTFFQLNWDRALDRDPDMIFVGGWNEWTMTKQEWGGEYAFVDNVNLEYSRDIEPMKGGCNDAFYMQMTDNIRKYKKTEVPAGKFDSVTPGADFDWNGVKAVFRKYEAVNEARDEDGKPETVHYITAAARNNAKEIRAVTDKDNIYFMIKCENAITAREEKTWMNLFIGTGELSLKGWEGYEYVINRSSQGSVDRLDESMKTTSCGQAEVTVKDNVMLITVARRVLGLEANNNSFYFKLADNVENSEDIMDYYVTGCSLPIGRMSFRYVG